MSFIPNDLIDVVEKEIGYAEKDSGYSKFGDWYSEHVDEGSYFKTAPWCDMFISWAADKAGTKESVGQFASTTSHAEWFKEKDAWSKKPTPGAIIFFDWSQSKEMSSIDHVGIVEKVRDGKVHTIEGNVDGGNLKRKVREDKDEIVGYGRPDQVAAKTTANAKAEDSAKAGTAQVRDGSTTSGTSAPGAASNGNVIPDPHQIAFSGLLVLLVAMIYVAAALAKARWAPVLVDRARTVPALVANAPVGRLAAQAKALVTAKVRAVAAQLPPGLVKKGKHHRRLVRPVIRVDDVPAARTPQRHFLGSPHQTPHSGQHHAGGVTSMGHGRTERSGQSPQRR